MADAMTFPNTWEEFEEIYGLTDTEQIYTNGSRLIPTFRVRQWLDHMDALMNMGGVYDGTADTPQTEEKHAICNGCVYCDLPNAFHPCASCVDFSKYVGEESGNAPQTDCGWK